MRNTFLVLALSLAFAAPSAAQQLTVAFNDGLVTIDAAAVPVRTILTEWAKKGGTKVVGVERVTGAPLTVKLVDVPEARALEVILRSVAGYMAAPRSTGAAGPSMYDRILVMATSSTPAPAAAAAPSRPQPNPAANGTQRFIPPQRQASDDDDEDAREEDPNPPNPPVFTFPGAPGQGGVQPGGFNQPFNQQQNGQPQMIVNPNTGAAGQTITINPSQPQNYPTTMPFGSSTPGVINAPPPPQPTRPPGGRQQQ